MFAIEPIEPGLWHLVLPAPGVPRPWGYPSNVYVMDGPSPTLVDTGWPQARPALLAALEVIGIAPRRVGRVLLTGTSPRTAGNVDMFEEASVVALRPVDGAEGWPDVLRAVCAVARELASTEPRHDAWHLTTVDAAEVALSGGALVHGTYLPAVPGQLIATAGGVAEAIAAPGAETSGAGWLVADRGWLFAGTPLVHRVDPIWTDLPSVGDSIARLAQTRPRLVLPALGPIERHPTVTFRSASLMVSNLMTNLQYAMGGTRTAVELVETDMGYRPTDLMRFAATVMRWDQALVELARGGIAERSEGGIRATYTMERRSRI